MNNPKIEPWDIVYLKSDGKSPTYMTVVDVLPELQTARCMWIGNHQLHVEDILREKDRPKKGIL